MCRAKASATVCRANEFYHTQAANDVRTVSRAHIYHNAISYCANVVDTLGNRMSFERNRLNLCIISRKKTFVLAIYILHLYPFNHLSC